jgi:hypothetical protein
MTENHDLNAPTEGSTDWHVPLNENFSKLDGLVEIRDSEANRTDYTPRDGAKFYSTDTGRVYLGDGSSWQEAAHALRPPQRSSDPESPQLGALWYRTDTDELRVQTAAGSETVAAGSTGETDDGSDATDQPSGAEAEVAVDFDDSSYVDTFTGSSNESRRELTSTNARNGQSLRVNIPEGDHNGTTLRYGFEDAGTAEPEELFAQYYVRFPTDLSVSGEGGKLPGPAGTYGDAGWGGREATGDDGWSARMVFYEADDPNEIRVGYYCYHVDMGGSYGDHFRWDKSLNPTRGEWHRIDQQCTMNTPGDNDGILRGWIDGELAFEKTDFRFRDTTDLKIEEHWFNIYWGGSWSSPDDNHIMFDDFSLSTQGRLF